MDLAMATLKTAAVEFESKMTLVRRLSAAGPEHTARRVYLARAISAGLMGLPQHPDLLAPNERLTVQAICASWAISVRNKINTVIDAAKAA